MATLHFNSADVKRCVEHAYAATEWSKGWGEEGAPHPQLIFVHDEGLYLMSNGQPRDFLADQPVDGGRSFVAYAKGYDPTTQDSGAVWDKARDAVGGDDFAEYLDLSEPMVAAIRAGGALRLKVTTRTIAIEVVRAK